MLCYWYSRQYDIAEFLVLKRKLRALDLLVRLRAGEALGEMTPVRCGERTSAVVRAGRGNMGARDDQLLAQRDDPRVACRRAGLDHQQRVAGFGPHRLRKRLAFALAQFADHIARGHEVGWFGFGECRASLAFCVV